MSEPRAAQVVEMNHIVLPGEANSLGAAFGGHVMSWIDMTAAIAAQRHCRMTSVTASMDELHFHSPLRVGWVAVLHARVLAAFRTSMEVGVTVHAEDPRTGERNLTTSALITFVALDEKGQRGQVPSLRLETDAERAAEQAAHKRRNARLANKDTSDRDWVKLVGG
jgi:acyl-CoA hydrolase